MALRNSFVVLMAVVAMLALAGCSRGVEVATDVVFARAYASVEEVRSFHITTSGSITAEGMEGFAVFTGHGDYLAPDRFQLFQDGAGGASGQIVIGDKMYLRLGESWRVLEAPTQTDIRGSDFGGLIGPIEVEFLNSPPESVLRLADEVIDGVRTWHFRLPARTSDPVQKLLEDIENEADLERKARLERLVESTRKIGEITSDHEVWIGQNDYLVRQLRVAQTLTATGGSVGSGLNIPEGTRYTVDTIVKLSEFNESVSIEPPADATPALP